MIFSVILTRLHRVTFLTAHQYLGLTKELVKTEKAINELASYPLPPEFYESGGIERLRQKFLPETKAVDRGERESETDYFSNITRKSSFPPNTPYMGPKMGRNMHTENSFTLGPEAVRMRHRSSATIPTISENEFWTSPVANNMVSPSSVANNMVSPMTASRSRDDSGALGDTRVSRNVGDLLSMTGLDQTSTNLSASPDFAPISLPLTDEPREGPRNGVSRHLSFAIGPADEFDLRDAVMNCISKSIGLIQPSPNVSPTIDASPVLHAQDQSLKRAVFSSSFGSLSYLGIQAHDDESSSMTASSTTGGLDAFELENETEILFFPRDSTLVKAGERGAGLFFVIEGWLDVSMPEGHIGHLGRIAKATSDAPSTATPLKNKSSIPTRPMSKQGSRQHSTTTTSRDLPRPKGTKALFSVKPGGIAGYLSSLSGFPSYVDIKAKTDVYVGFLPAKALDTIMDKQPIVLLTLAKRLISLLPPLVVHIDSALEWMQVNAGQVIYRQGERADSFYFVNQGRLRLIADKAGTGGVEILAEYGQGDSVGERKITRSSVLQIVVK